LRETEAYLSYLNIVWERRDIALAYMTFGGIPFYLNQLRPGMSYAQNVDALCFEKDAFMRGEFEALYSSLFRNADAHVDILEALSAKKRGLTREEILARTGLTSGGGASVVLRELEQCGFIEKFNDYSGKHGRYVYQLTDFFTLFYFKQMKRNKQLGSGYWSKMIGSGAYYNWAGQTFEKLCLLHIENIRAKLGISGILATPFAWNGSGTDAGAQIDLLIDRTDGIINIVECKFAGEPFVVDKQYSENLRNKTSAFKQTSKTRKALHLTMITTFGVKANKYAGMIQSEVLLDDLFM
jgi:predicted transcriptional regulator